MVVGTGDVDMRAMSAVGSVSTVSHEVRSLPGVAERQHACFVLVSFSKCGK